MIIGNDNFSIFHWKTKSWLNNFLDDYSKQSGFLTSGEQELLARESLQHNTFYS